jgi:hypothetical protein
MQLSGTTPRPLPNYPIVRPFNHKHTTILRLPGQNCLACTTLERGFKRCLCNRRSSVDDSVGQSRNPSPSHHLSHHHHHHHHPPPSTIATYQPNTPVPRPGSPPASCKAASRAPAGQARAFLLRAELFKRSIRHRPSQN